MILISYDIRCADCHEPREDVRTNPRKGTIAVGSDADVVIWDDERELIIRNDMLHHNVDYTPYEGMAIKGWPWMVLSRGGSVWEGGKVTAQPGR